MPKIHYPSFINTHWPPTKDQSQTNFASRGREKNGLYPGEVGSTAEIDALTQVIKKAEEQDRRDSRKNEGAAARAKIEGLFGKSRGWLSGMTVEEVNNAVRVLATDLSPYGEHTYFYRGLTVGNGEFKDLHKDDTNADFTYKWLHQDRGAPAISSVLDCAAPYVSNAKKGEGPPNPIFIEFCMHGEDENFFGAKGVSSPYTHSTSRHHEFRLDNGNTYLTTAIRQIDIATYARLTKISLTRLRQKLEDPNRPVTLMEISCRGRPKKENGQIDLTSFKMVPKKGASLLDIRLVMAQNVKTLTTAIKDGEVEKAEALLKIVLEGKKIDLNMCDDEGRSPLELAAAKGHSTLVSHMLENKTSNISNAHIGTALVSAVEQGHQHIVEVLLDAGASLNAVNARTGQTALQAAVLRGEESLVKFLLNKGVDINKAEKTTGFTALHTAAQCGNSYIARILLERGADLYAATPYKETALSIAKEKKGNPVASLIESHIAGIDALHRAVKNKEIERVRTLAERYSGIISMKDGSTLLEFAMVENYLPEIATHLLENGVNPNPAKGEKAAIDTAVNNGNAELVKLFLEKGADINTVGRDDHAKDGYTPLDLALEKRDGKIVKLLLEHGPKSFFTPESNTALLKEARKKDDECCRLFDKYNDFFTKLTRSVNDNSNDELRSILDSNNVNWGNTVIRETDSNLLNLAATNGYTDIAKTLLENGASPDAAALDNNRTPLMNAAYQGHADIVKLLLKKGAHIDTANRTGWTALNSAADQGYFHIVQSLLDHGADPDKYSPLVKALRRGHNDIAVLLLDKGASPDEEASRPIANTPLGDAAARGNNEAIALLLEHGADINCLNTKRQTPLMHAVLQGQTETVELLLSKGAYINAPDRAGRTPLHLAASQRNPKTVELLLDKGLDINCTDSQGQTPLMHAVLHGQAKIVECLLDRGAAVNIQDMDGWTPLHKAAQQGNDKAIELLLAHGADINVQNRTSPGDKKQYGEKYAGTPLNQSVMAGNVNSTRLLLERGADVKCGYPRPLPLAVAQGNTDAVMLLLQGGADANTVIDIRSQKTLLHHAAEQGSLKTVQLLTAFGAKQHRDSSGNTPTNLSIIRGHSRITELLSTAIQKNTSTQRSTAIFMRMLGKGKRSNATVSAPGTPKTLASLSFERFPWLAKLNESHFAISTREVQSLTDFIAREFIKRGAQDGAAIDEHFAACCDEIDELVIKLGLRTRKPFFDTGSSLKREILSTAASMAPDKQFWSIIATFQKLSDFAEKDRMVIREVRKRMDQDVKRYYGLPQNSKADRIKRVTEDSIKNLTQGEIILHTMHLFNLENEVTKENFDNLLKSITSQEVKNFISSNEKQVVGMKFKEAIAFLFEKIKKSADDADSRNTHPASLLLNQCSGFVFHPNYASAERFVNPDSPYSFEQISRNLANKYSVAKQQGKLEDFFENAFSRTDPCYEAAAQCLMHYGNPEPLVVSYSQPSWNEKLSDVENVQGLFAWLERALIDSYAKDQSIDLTQQSEKEVQHIQGSKEYAIWLMEHKEIFKDQMAIAVEDRIPHGELETMALDYLKEGLKFALNQAA